jgi:hypothetical protein
LVFSQIYFILPNFVHISYFVYVRVDHVICGFLHCQFTQLLRASFGLCMGFHSAINFEKTYCLWIDSLQNWGISLFGFLCLFGLFAGPFCSTTFIVKTLIVSGIQWLATSQLFYMGHAFSCTYCFRPAYLAEGFPFI